MRLNRVHGCSIVFKRGLSIGFNWVHSDWTRSHTTATLVAYHHPRSVTWRWALRWTKPSQVWCPFKFTSWFPCGKNSPWGNYTLTVPLVGMFTLDYQAPMWRR